MELQEWKQKAFDLAWKGLEAQNWEPAADENGGCFWMDLSGRKCAVGHLLRREAFLGRDSEGRVAGDTDRAIIEHLLLPELDVEYQGYYGELPELLFLDEMQGAHDDEAIHRDGRMSSMFRDIAASHGLTVPGGGQ